MNDRYVEFVRVIAFALVSLAALLLINECNAGLREADMKKTEVEKIKAEKCVGKQWF